jgi:hypothetical protein
MVFIGILLVRILLIKGFAKKATSIAQYVAPRGLITILLFYSIPKESFDHDGVLIPNSDLTSQLFEPGIILWVVIISSVYMTYGLVKSAFMSSDDAEEEPQVPDVG